MTERQSRAQSDLVLDAVVVGKLSEGLRTDLELVAIDERPGPDLATVRVDPVSFAYLTFQRGVAEAGQAWRIYANRQGSEGLALTLCARNERLEGREAETVKRKVSAALGPIADAPAAEEGGWSLRILALALGGIACMAAVVLILRGRRTAG